MRRVSGAECDLAAGHLQASTSTARLPSAPRFPPSVHPAPGTLTSHHCGPRQKGKLFVRKTFNWSFELRSTLF